MGGCSPNFSDAFDSVYEFDPAEGGGTWTRKNNMNVPRFNHSSVVVDDKIYVIGGRRDLILPIERSVEMYDPVTNTWKFVDSMNIARHIFSASVFDDKIYVTGGYTPDSTISSIEIYDPQDNSWTVIGHMPKARIWHSSAVIGNKILIYGGASSSDLPIPGTWEFNPSDITFRDVEDADLPETLIWFPDEVVEGENGEICIYIFGGAYPNFYNWYFDHTIPPPHVTNAVYKSCYLLVSRKEPEKVSVPVMLFQNYPNPFNSITTFQYKLRNTGKVSIKVFNLAGQEMITLFDGFQPAGKNEIEWKPEGLPGGVYFYSLQTEKGIISGKCILQKIN